MFLNKVLPFGEWLPDQPAYGNAVTVVKNCIPQAQSYRSVNGLSAFSNALTGQALAAFWVKDAAQNYYNFAGDATKLYLLNGDTFSSVSQAGNYTVTSWEFAKWGERIIAVAGEEVPQYYDMGTSTLFADLPGSPPKAKHIAVIRDFIFLGNLVEGADTLPNRVRWSGYNASELWTSSLSTQSDYQDLFGRGGAVQKIVPGEYGLIFQEHAIRRVTYEGPPRIFRFDEIATDLGTPCPNSVCWQGTTVYFYSHDGFYVYDGQGFQPIGAEKVDRFIAQDLNTSDLNAMRGAVDRKNRAVFWLYPSRETGASRMICFKQDVKRWSIIDVSAELIFEFTQSAYDLDTIDALLTSGIDTDSFNMDASPYKGGTLDFVAFDTAHKLATFSGSPLTAVIETGEIGEPMYRHSIKSARPIAGGTATMRVAARDQQNESYTYGNEQERNAKGECNFRTSGRYHRFKVSLSGGFDHAQGVQVIYRNEGRQ